jgi:phospholipid N-methyltransferase
LHLLSEIQQALKPGGWFVAYQYSLQMKELLELRFQTVKTLVPLNLPPGFIYVCR